MIFAVGQQGHARHLAVFYTSEHAEIFAAAVYYEHICGSVKLAVAVASARRLNHTVEPRAEPYHAAERYIDTRFNDLRRDANHFWCVWIFALSFKRAVYLGYDRHSVRHAHSGGKMKNHGVFQIHFSEQIRRLLFEIAYDKQAVCCAELFCNKCGDCVKPHAALVDYLRAFEYAPQLFVKRHNVFYVLCYRVRRLFEARLSRRAQDYSRAADLREKVYRCVEKRQHFVRHGLNLVYDYHAVAQRVHSAYA